MRGWAFHRCGWPSEGEDPSREGWGWEDAEATLSQGTSSVTAARSCGTEPGGGTAGQVFHLLPSAQHLVLAILFQGQDIRRPPSDLCQALLCLRKPQFQSLGNGIKSCGNELMLPLFNPLGTASRLKKQKQKKLPCLLPVLLTCEDGGSTKQWWENNPGLSLCDVSCQALCYHCYSPQLLGKFYKTWSLNKIFLQNPCSFQLSHSFSATIPWERSRCSVAVKRY